METESKKSALLVKDQGNAPAPPSAEAAGGDAAYYSDSSASSDSRIMLGADIEIYPGRPREDLASTGTQAYEAKSRSGGEQFALICGRATVPRITSISAYKHIKNPAILKLVEAGVVNWKPENRQRFAFVFEKPPNKKLMQSLEAKPHRFSEDRIIPSLIQPIISLLADLRNVDFVHGAINPMNIFLSGIDGGETALLGECLTSAPSWRQHALFEPPDRAMAQPTGRGMGTGRDDLYAFGVCVIFAARGENLLADKTPEQIIRGKIEEGSYSFLVGGTRLPGGISDFLRGVLNDDESQRWTVQDTLSWIEGRRLSPKQPRPHLRSARPFLFKNEKYWDLRSIANAFSHNTAEAGKVIEQDHFDLWIKRNFEDKTLLKRFESVWEKEKGGSHDKIVSGACMALDPIAPVRYKELSVFPSGFGNALADAIARGEDIQTHGEIILQQLFSNWVNLRFEEITDASGILSLYEKCRNYLTQKISGYGIERVLYTLNKDCACLSPLLKNYFVLGPGRILLALEDLSRQGNRPDYILDRHMCAFISVHEPRLIDPYLGHITSPDKGNQIVGIIRTLSAIQKRFNVGPVPGVSAWMASLCAPVIERFNDSDLKKELSKHLERAGSSGDLSNILALVDDPAVMQEDDRRFAAARQEYALLGREKIRINGYLKKRKFFGQATGRQVSMLVSSVLSLLCIAGYLAFYLTQRAH